MLKIKETWLILLLVSICLLVIVLYSSTRTTQITTTPIPAEVWLDGKRVGETPCKIRLFDSKTHEIKIIALDTDQKYDKLGVQFYPIRYTFTLASMPEELAIPLLPTGCAPPDVAMTGRSCMSSDWHWVMSSVEQGPLLANLENPMESLPADGMITVSPDGKFGVYDDDYGTWPSPSGETRLWLAPVDQPDKRTRVFEELVAGGRLGYMGHGPQIRFSPDSKWFWFAYGNRVDIAPVYDPAKVTILVNYDGFNPFWSPTGDRFTIMPEDNQVVIYTLHQGNWQKLSDAVYTGLPLTWSRDGSQLWVTERKTGGEWGENVKMIDLLNESQVLWVDFPGEISNGLTSKDNTVLAVNYHPFWDSGEGKLAVIMSNGEVLTLNNQLDYGEIIYWINNHLLMVYVSPEVHIIDIRDMAPLQP